MLMLGILLVGCKALGGTCTWATRHGSLAVFPLGRRHLLNRDISNEFTYTRFIFLNYAIVVTHIQEGRSGFTYDRSMAV